MVSAAAGVLAALDLRHKCVVVDHLTIGDIDPDDWDQVFLLAAETTFKIRSKMNEIGDKLVVICTSREPGLDRWQNVFFPHWLFSIRKPKTFIGGNYKQPKYLFDALMGRAKDPRTLLLQTLERRGLLDKGLIGYAPGNYYGPENKLNPNRYFRGLWEYEPEEIRTIYGTELNYLLSRDSTTRLQDGHFSSGLIPTEIYKQSKFTLVAETDNIGNHVFVTEKTWKSLIAEREVIFYATPGHEEFLESLGFELAHKCGSDHNAIADMLKDLDEQWLPSDNNGLHRHNRELCNPQRWISVLFSWLDRNVRT